MVIKMIISKCAISLDKFYIDRASLLAPPLFILPTFFSLAACLPKMKHV